MAVLLLLGGTACAAQPPARADVVRVPQDASTIAQAVTRVKEGGLVLISPGLYRESVRVAVPGVTLRGLDRNTVVLDGEGTRPDGVVVTAPGVSVENLTVTRYAFNGVLVTGMTDGSGAGLGRGSTGYKPLDPARFPLLDGFAVRYVTASNNGLYGIYAFDAKNGVIERNHASGGSDSGIYLGQCKPCNTVIRDNVAEHNAVGLENANASKGVYVLGNRLTGNRVGLSITSDYQEAFIPQQESVVAGNLIADNASADSPAHAEGAFGVGVGIGGGQDNLIVRNRIEGNPSVGVIVSSSEDLSPIGNRVTGNAMARNGTDLAYVPSHRAPGKENCFLANNTRPPARLPRCPAGALPHTAPRAVRPPAGLSFLDVPPPPAQASMADPLTAPHPRAAGVTADWRALAVPGPGLLDGGRR